MKVEMPNDWDDRRGWESYFASLPSDAFWYNASTSNPGQLFHLIN